MDYLSASDPFVVVNCKVNNRWVEIGRTEIVVNNENPVFVKKIIMNYVFESIQHLQFVVYDADEDKTSEQIVLDRQDLIGVAESFLSDIVHHRGATTLDLKLNGADRGTLVVKCEELAQCNGVVRGRFTGIDFPSNCFFCLSNILFV